MSCEETRQLISSYVDDILSPPARKGIDEHLNKCPVCRAQVSELRSISRQLAMLPSPVPPADLAPSITDALMIELAARQQAPDRSVTTQVIRWLEPWLMPYSVGSFASVILFVAMFAGLKPHFVALREAAARNDLLVITSDLADDLNQPLTPEGFAASRAPFAIQSPSLNPSGALAELTRSYTHPHSETMEDADDMVVVADVFSNGAASLAGVVQPPRDRRMLDEFETALRQDAAFVPASMDRRPDTMRVVFAVQKVDVKDRNF